MRNDVVDYHGKDRESRSTPTQEAKHAMAEAKSMDKISCDFFDIWEVWILEEAARMILSSLVLGPLGRAHRENGNDDLR